MKETTPRVILDLRGYLANRKSSLRFARPMDRDGPSKLSLARSTSEKVKQLWVVDVSMDGIK